MPAPTRCLAHKAAFPRETRNSVWVVGFKLDVADRPIEKALGPLHVVDQVASRPVGDVPEPQSLLQGIAVEAGELHLAKVLDLRHLQQWFRQRGDHRVEFPVGRRRLRANPLIESVNDLSEHFRLRPGRQQRIEMLAGLIVGLGLIPRIEPADYLLDDVGRIELLEAIEIVDGQLEQLLVILAREGLLRRFFSVRSGCLFVATRQEQQETQKELQTANCKLQIANWVSATVPRRSGSCVG